MAAQPSASASSAPSQNHDGNQPQQQQSLMMLPPPPASSSTPASGFPREPQSLEDLLKWSLRNAGPNDQLHQFTEERRRWLEDALKSLTVDTIELMKTHLEKLENPASSEHELAESLDAINEIVQDLDNARDLYLLGGLPPLIPLLSHASENVRALTAELIATTVQNHPDCQTRIYEDGRVLPRLLAMLQNEPSVKAMAKVIRALSCLVRDHLLLHQAFVRDLDGVRLLLGALSPAQDRSIQTKLLYMLSNLCVADPAIKESLGGIAVVVTVAQVLDQHALSEDALDLWENALRFLLLAIGGTSLASVYPSSSERSVLEAVLDKRRAFIRGLASEEQVRYAPECRMALSLKKLQGL